MNSPKLTNILPNFIRDEFESVCKRRFFFGPSFDAYGGLSGLYDLGPSCVSIKNNLLNLWREHFVTEESMLEVEAPCITMGDVFKASGHVDRFTDVMSKDVKTGECVRLDKHIEDWCTKRLLDAAAISADEQASVTGVLRAVGGMSKDELDSVVSKHGILSPAGNALSSAFDFNLMFASTIGSEGGRRVFLRPELAQGICLNFKRLSDSCATSFPFAACAVGQAFRNEIAPRASLLRVREFTLAEIEHFINPSQKEHPKFASVQDTEIWVWSQESQRTNCEPVRMRIQEAVASGVIANESIGYFIGRIDAFVRRLGVRHIRYRQHLEKEMAHYAQDCWDCELLTSYGWMECIGIADRSAYDLKAHAHATKKEFYAWESYPEPRTETVVEKKVASGLIGKTFGRKTAAIVEHLKGLSDADALLLDDDLSRDGAKTIEIPAVEGPVDITRGMVAFAKSTKVSHGRNFIPAIIESSFGVGRILYALLEQSYFIRSEGTEKSETRAFFTLAPFLCPWKVAVFPLMCKPELLAPLERLQRDLLRAHLSCRCDSSGAAIGKKYARVDEIGIPFAITVDYDTLADGTVTLRDRDSMEQIRVPLQDVVRLLKDLCEVGGATWMEAKLKYTLTL